MPTPWVSLRRDQLIPVNKIVQLLKTYYRYTNTLSLCTLEMKKSFLNFNFMGQCYDHSLGDFEDFRQKMEFYIKQMS
jgi:hypothetical protein